MCLNAGAMGRRDAETETLIPTTGAVFDDADVAHSLRAEGFDASEDGTGRGTPIVPVQQPFSIMPMNSGKDYKARETDVAQPIMAGGPVGGNQGGDFIAQTIAFSAKDSGADAAEEVSPTLRAGGHTGSHANAGVMPAIAYAANGVTADPVTAVQGKSYTNEGNNFRLQNCVDQAWGVRRLTPTECERLQGFPDGWTAIPWGKKTPEDCPDGPRYKALGNSFAVNVIVWIGERIQAVMEVENANVE